MSVLLQPDLGGDGGLEFHVVRGCYRSGHGFGRVHGHHSVGAHHFGLGVMIMVIDVDGGEVDGGFFQQAGEAFGAGLEVGDGFGNQGFIEHIAGLGGEGVGEAVLLEVHTLEFSGEF